MTKEDILKYDRLVYSIIKSLTGNPNQEDLYQVGMIGLLKACENYNEYDNTKFSTYAYLYILGEITKYLRENKTIRVSKDTIRLYKSIEKGRDLLRNKIDREPSDQELSNFLEIDLNTIDKVEKSLQSVESLDSLVNDNGINYYNSVKVYDKGTSSEILDLNNALNNLLEEEKELIMDSYYNGYTQTEISKKLGISQVQVSRKVNKVLQKLKNSL